MQATCDWLEGHQADEQPFLLFVDEFDPHEPFDTPEPWANRYDPDWEGELLIWPPYSERTVERGVLTEAEARHVRANYGSKMSMIDHWFGKVLDTLDAKNLWQDTMVIVCTDHGHYLGERDIFGKPGVPHFEPLGHTPLMIYHPDASVAVSIGGTEIGQGRSGSGLWPASTAAGCTFSTVSGNTHAARCRMTTCRYPCGRTGGRRCPCTSCLT